MLKIYAKNENILLRSLLKNDISTIHKWYNGIDRYGLATGKTHAVTMDALINDIINDLHYKTFYIALCLRNKTYTDPIGLIKGRAGSGDESYVWLYIFLIDEEYQDMGYGSMALRLFENYLKDAMHTQKIYISVAEQNLKAIRFWNKFGYLNILCKNNIIIMRKELT